MRPRGSVIIGNSSCCSRMTGLMAERKSTASISKRALFSAPSMMSSVTASTSTSADLGDAELVGDCHLSSLTSLGVIRMLKLASTAAR